MHNSQYLNSAQLEAVTTIDRPVCILAGAGTGKTRVITYRIAYLIEQRGAQPNQILGVTFTNKAAMEMRARVEVLLPGLGRYVQLGTFHGLAARILRKLGPLVDVPSSFLIYDQDDSERLLKQIASQRLNLSRDHVGPFLAQIDSWRNEGILPKDVPSTYDPKIGKAVELYHLYLQGMQEIGAVDFNGLLLKWRELTEHEEGLAYLHNQYRHILVDEYQDTNSVQAQIVLALARGAETIAIVGDDDQSIYSWRGANAGNMQQFLDKLPNVKLIRLEENYRSTREILTAANGVIAKNQGRIGKNLIAVRGSGEAVRVMQLFNDRREAQQIIHMIEEELVRGRSLDDFAILMRTNAMSRPFEDSLRQIRMPYRLIGGVKFYDRKEVKDVLATLRVALNPKSDIDLQRSLAAVSRGVGDTSVKKALDIARKHTVSLMEVLRRPELLQEAGIAPRTCKKVVEFAGHIADLGQKAAASETTADEAIALAIDVSGVAQMLQAENTEEADDRLENLSQLLAAAKQHVEDAQLANADANAQSFLEAAALLSSSDEVGENESNGAVTLMTLHAAKGLEFDTVYMVGLEEYGFPHARALEEGADPNQLEEERRLAYVGMTRARKRLFITYVQRRMIRGSVKGRVPSRFLRELPRDVVEGDLPVARTYESYTPMQSTQQAPQYEGFEPDPAFLDSAEPPSRLSIGARVWHGAFGGGVVLDQQGSGRLLRALVRFDMDGKKRTIIARHLRVA